MAHSAREKISRRSWLLAGLAAPLFRARAGSPLTVSFDGDNLRVSAPELHFLTGQALTRLKDGLTVMYVSQLTLFRDDRITVFRRAPERFFVSYDLWEEKFKIALGTDRSAARLTLPAAEAWCMENLAISALGLAPDRPFWLRLELRTADPKEFSSVVGDPGISIRGLVEIFSRKPAADEPHWSIDAGPLRLPDVPRIKAHGTRNG